MPTCGNYRGFLCCRPWATQGGLIELGYSINLIINSVSKVIDEQTFWERTSTSRWGTYISEVEDRLIRRAHQIAGQPSAAIEIGVDAGRWSKLLSELGWKMICTDIDPKTLAICQQRIPTAHCICVDPDSQEFPCETSSVKLMLCVEVPTVLISDWFIEESFRCLQPAGVVLGVFLNRRSLRGLLKRWSPNRDHSSYYNSAYSQWRSKFVNRGFTMVHEEGICWFPFRRDSNSRFIPAAVSLERKLGLRRLTSISPWIVFVAQKGSVER